MRQGSPKKVLILDQVVANQIAAGEVVERPYNAIKELIENAVDACANHILVEIEEGGLKLIRVVDDGYGMEEADACNAIQRHGTSKLQKIEDLQKINTLGFRGEALPSIVSISNFSIKTKTAQQVSATKIELQGGKQLKVSHCAGNTGTEIEARDLFFNVPARKVFQKSPQKESDAIRDLVLQQAICYPDIAFKLIVDGKEIIDLPMQNHLRSRLNRLFDKNVIDHLHPIEYQSADFSLHGYISDLNLLYTTNRHFYTYVNDRVVKHQFFWQCLSQALGARLAKGKYPFMALKMKLDGQLVDVNIHPNKIDVRFANEERIKKILENLFAEVIDRFPEVQNQEVVVPQVQIPMTPIFNHLLGPQLYPNDPPKIENKLPEITKRDLFINPSPSKPIQQPIQQPIQPLTQPPIQQPIIKPIQPEAPIQPTISIQQSLFQDTEKHQVDYIPSQVIQTLQINEFGQVDKKSQTKIDDLKLSFKHMPSYKQIGLIKNRWWQVEGEDGIAMIDLGMVRALLVMEKSKYQPMDASVKLEFNAEELQRLQVRHHLLKDFGIGIQKKEQGFFLEQISNPALISADEVIQLLHTYLQIDQMVQARERLISAIAELSLSSQQISALISQLSSIDEIFYQKPMLRSYYRIRSFLKYQDLLKNQI